MIDYRTVRAALALAAAGTALSGCVQLRALAHGTKDAGQPEIAAAPAIVLPTFAEIGRSQLEQHQYGAAIASFQTALAIESDPAAALNGMAIAYAALDRPDAAEGLFRKAVELAPEDDRYRRNLARATEVLAFRSSAARAAQLAQATIGDVASSPLSAPETPSAAARTAVAATGRLEEVGKGQFRIRTGGNAGRPATAVVTNFRPVVRMDMPAAKPVAAAAAEKADAQPTEKALADAPRAKRKVVTMPVSSDR